MLSTILSVLTQVAPLLSGIAGPLWASVQKYWQYYLIFLLVAANTFSYHEWQHVSTDLHTEKVAHAADIKAFKDAQAEADARAKQIADTLTQQSKAKAHEADSKYRSLYAQYRANLVRYQAAQRASNQSSGGGTGGTAQGPNGSGQGPVVPATTGPLIITAQDAQICAENTAKLQVDHDWALTKDKPQ